MTPQQQQQVQQKMQQRARRQWRRTRSARAKAALPALGAGRLAHAPGRAPRFGRGDDGGAHQEGVHREAAALAFVFRHASKCHAPEGRCAYAALPRRQVAVGARAAVLDPQCAYPRCLASRELLKHHQNCKDARCPVCAARALGDAQATVAGAHAAAGWRRRGRARGGAHARGGSAGRRRRRRFSNRRRARCAVSVGQKARAARARLFWSASRRTRCARTWRLCAFRRRTR